MNDKERERLEALREIQNHAQGICNPMEYFNRQAALTHNVINWLLEPLVELEAEEAEEQAKVTHWVPLPKES